MARKVRCQITKEYGTSDTFYKATNGKYYKTKELYDAWEKESRDRADVIQRFAEEFLGYSTGQVFPTILTKKLKELEFYGYDVINRTIDRCYKNIVYAIQSKDFSNDSGKISYIFAIIKNNINDVYKEVLAEEKAERNASHYEVDTSVDIDHIQTKQKQKNISKWLEEDGDWL